MTTLRRGLSPAEGCRRTLSRGTTGHRGSEASHSLYRSRRRLSHGGDHIPNPV